MIDDTELLRRYAGEGAEEAFAELVARHVNLVHSAALRQVHGDAQLAADATQVVFADLARKARALTGHRVLAGWLFTSARYAAAKLVRGEVRRRAREQEAWRMENETGRGDEAAAELDWSRVREVLDEAMADLGSADREAVLLRFFEGRDYAAVAERLGLSPNAARMRVDRALDKLRAQLARRGVTSTGAALAAALAGQAVVAAPAGLAAAVTSGALAGAATGGSGLVAAIFMSMGKTQIGVTGVLLAAGTAGYVLQSQEQAALRAEIAALGREAQRATELTAENQRLARRAAEVADLRADDARLAQVRDEAAALQARLRAEAAERQRAEAAARARAPLTGEVYEISRLDRTPAPQFQARPEYPAELRRFAVNGEAVVDFIVDAEGTVREAKAVRSGVKPPPGAAIGMSEREMAEKIEAAAIAAVSKWRFAPGEKDGKKVNARLQIPIVFTMGAPGGTRPAPTLWF
jgi:RNA polymerase sigma factor (sigma-70 family)